MTDFSAQPGSELRLKRKRFARMSTVFQQRLEAAFSGMEGKLARSLPKDKKCSTWNSGRNWERSTKSRGFYRARRNSGKKSSRMGRDGNESSLIRNVFLRKNVPRGTHVPLKIGTGDKRFHMGKSWFRGDIVIRCAPKILEAGGAFVRSRSALSSFGTNKDFVTRRARSERLLLSVNAGMFHVEHSATERLEWLAGPSQFRGAFHERLWQSQRT
jgi:hypothetical protein